jgi:hypothetical protein
MLLKHQREKQERVRQQAVALADRLQNVLFLSDDVAVNNNEEAA